MKLGLILCGTVSILVLLFIGVLVCKASIDFFSDFDDDDNEFFSKHHLNDKEGYK